VKSRLLIVILSAACAASTQTVRAVPVHLEAIASIPEGIQFFCMHNYENQACLKDASHSDMRWLRIPWSVSGRGRSC
jgi:hypothetical protein